MSVTSLPKLFSQYITSHSVAINQHSHFAFSVATIKNEGSVFYVARERSTIEIHSMGCFRIVSDREWAHTPLSVCICVSMQYILYSQYMHATHTLIRHRRGVLTPDARDTTPKSYSKGMDLHCIVLYIVYFLCICPTRRRTCVYMYIYRYIDI